MIVYHFKRKAAQIEVFSSSFYWSFVFIACWMLTRIAYFTDAFYNYSYDLSLLLDTMPLVFTLATMTIALYNVLSLCHCLEAKDHHDDDY